MFSIENLTFFGIFISWRNNIRELNHIKRLKLCRMNFASNYCKALNQSQLFYFNLKCLSDTGIFGVYFFLMPRTEIKIMKSSNLTNLVKFGMLRVSSIRT